MGGVLMLRSLPMSGLNGTGCGRRAHYPGRVTSLLPARARSRARAGSAAGA